MKARTGTLIQRDVSLRPFNTFGVDASAALFARVQSLEDLQRVLTDRRVVAAPLLVLGSGSNVLFTQDFDGCVLKIEIPGLQRDDDGGRWLVQVGAGENWHTIVERLIDENAPGLENLALIPGSVGAAPIQNIGAYGVELAERFHSLQVWDLEAQALQTLTADDCRFGYRDSVFKRETELRVIVNVTLALPRQWVPVIGYADVESELRDRNIAQLRPRDVFDAVIAIRRRKLPDPAQVGNAGSFFKNPTIDNKLYETIKKDYPAFPSYPSADGLVKIPAAWLIEQCGWKGKTFDHIGVHKNQALVLVNYGGGEGKKIWQLALDIKASVEQKFNITLQPEVNVIG